MNMPHTPTPWFVYCAEIKSVANPRKVICDPWDAYEDNGTRRRLLSIDEREANAAHIVRCVNSHDELVAALAALTVYVDSYGYGRAWAGRPHDLCDAARAALRSATQP